MLPSVEATSTRNAERPHRSPLTAAIVIFLLSFTVRAYLLSRLSPNDITNLLPSPSGLLSADEGINIARALFESARFADPFSIPTGPSAHLPPAYPAVTALIYWIFGLGLAGGIVRNLVSIAGISVLFAVLPGSAERLKLGRRAGILGGLAGACYPAFRSSEIFRGRDEWLSALILLWLIHFVVRIRESPQMRLRSAAVFGLGWGLLAYVNPGVVPLFPFYLLMIVVPGRNQSFSSRAAFGLVACSTLAAAVLPWSLRNREALGGWFFMRDNVGIELYMSNADGTVPSLAGNLASGRHARYHPVSSPAVAMEVRRVGELQYNRTKLAEAREWISSHRKQFIDLVALRIVYFWCGELSDRAASLPRISISVAAAIGLLLMIRARLVWQTMLLAPAYLIYPLPFYIIQYSNRYIIPIAFALFLPAGFALASAWTLLRRSQEPDPGTPRAAARRNPE